MTLENLNHLDLDKDTKEILKIFLNDDNLLKYLIIPPISADHNVLNEPSIIETKTLSERFNEYYLGEGFQPIFINWAKWPNEDVEEKGRILFYPNPVGLHGHIDKSNYIFDCFVPYSWHVKTNVAYKVLRRVVQLLKNTHTFGDIGKVDFQPATSIFAIPNYVGYRIVANNYNFVG